jgi:hypothetical protein
MYKHVVRKITLALTLALIGLATPAIHASTSDTARSTSPVVATDGVTGTDPEPTSPNVVQTILILLYLA